MKLLWIAAGVGSAWFLLACFVAVWFGRTADRAEAPRQTVVSGSSASADLMVFVAPARARDGRQASVIVLPVGRPPSSDSEDPFSPSAQVPA